MNCDDVRSKLTAYLDGELEDNRGSAIRGHLRTCDACSAIATDEAALRDGLRELPPLDPPNALWSGIQARLAAEEVADAERPGWRRAVSRLAERWRPMVPQLALGSAALAIAIVVLAVRYRDSREIPSGQPIAGNQTGLVIEPVAPTPPQPQAVIPGDVATEIATERTDRTATQRRVVDRLVDDAKAARATACIER